MKSLDVDCGRLKDVFAILSSSRWQQFGALGPMVLGLGGLSFFILIFWPLIGLSCGMWGSFATASYSLLAQAGLASRGMGSQFPNRDGTHIPCRWILNPLDH